MTPDSKTFGFLPLRSDRTIAPGTLNHGTGGALRISVAAEHYRIEAGDVRNLLFYGRAVPITRSRVTPGGIAIEGHAVMNASGKAVMLHTHVGSYIVPLVSLQRVARGEVVSASLFPHLPDKDFFGEMGLRKPKIFEERRSNGTEREKPSDFEGDIKDNLEEETTVPQWNGSAYNRYTCCSKL